ncbi:TspO/MBR family-domain-containing protein [Tribonema minus]|uniref:TspO/MBR family-domain-containing protein n=1 Tax=Tribonema minus TaxID=303371 RepID=A0A835Z2U8_9STRA|nr:TspO/MBR family-domain-containing protein [Tribonema minus]
MRFLSCTLVVLAACCCSSARAAPHAPSGSVQRNPLHKVNNVRGGGDLTSTSPPKTVGLGRVMNLRTALEYKGFAIAETGLLLGVLQLARKLAARHPLDIKYMRAVDYTAWAVIALGSDWLVGVIRLLLVKLQLAKPRVNIDESLRTWYRLIAKPKWTPADWVFPTVWIPLKLMQVLGARIIWLQTGRDPLATPIVLYCLHAALGDNWNTAFFREQYITGGLSIIVQFFAALLATTYIFYQMDPVAGNFLLPTCVWVTIATTLNYSIYRRNK